MLLAYAPSVNLKDVVKGLLLHSKLAPAFIRVSNRAGRHEPAASPRVEAEVQSNDHVKSTLLRLR